MNKTTMWIIFLAGVVTGHALTRVLGLFRVFAPLIIVVIIGLAVWLYFRRRPHRL